MKYRRIFVPGACYFLTFNLQNRRSDLLTRHIRELRFAFQQAINAYPFKIDGIVVLPEHIHITMTLPANDSNYPLRISFIKGAFSRQINTGEFINASRKSKRERGIWQRRYWEHFIRDERDYENHLNYIHNNPVKHGYVKSASQWPYSSIHRYIKLGILPASWKREEAKRGVFKLQL